MADYHVLVIGGGAAGLSAAAAAAKHGCRVLLLEALYTGGKAVKVPLIGDYPGFPDGISGEALTDRLEQSMIDAGVKVLHEKVEDMELSGAEKQVITDRGRYTAQVVIAATGLRRRELGLSKEHALIGMGLFHEMEDVGRVKDKVAAVFGSGNEACRRVLALSDVCPKVYWISPEEEPDVSKKFLDAIAEKTNVEVQFGCLVADVTEGVFFLENMTLVNRCTTEIKTVPVEALFVSPMPEPDSDVFLGHLRMTDDGAIRIDANMATSQEGVFAAGAVREGSKATFLEAVADGIRAGDAVNRYLIACEQTYIK